MNDYDPRIVALYDADNPDGPDHDYYRSRADQIGARRIIDVGCGTGILTVTLAGKDREVLGLDPSTAMLEYARVRPGAERVQWIEGDCRVLNHRSFDYAVMSGNVAQHIPDPLWQQTLENLRRNLAIDSLLCFESRNPLRRAWETWAKEEPTTRMTPFGLQTEWCQTRELGDGKVLLESFARFEDSGEIVQDDVVLVFRTDQQINSQLEAAGFVVENIWGTWDRTPFDGSQAVMIFEARAR
ncbi:class I SAM-dependent methyltransferase [Glutamicibacter mishrai]|uniref:Class I SAM-dependent methyltransferase n=1 Tax=Glutamicibacter mishrai TaxID=1775880 RepID=A0A6H0SF97_9MICC|nr:class I SAM-dependent methyltransferase [Glutamicibacter mishrai]QIV86068.1 class I SAM-dependent methyltransferase [Glutamicibacter mishrai]